MDISKNTKQLILGGIALIGAITLTIGISVLLTNDDSLSADDASATASDAVKVDGALPPYTSQSPGFTASPDNNQCGEACGGSLGLCADGFTCTYASQSICDSSMTAICTPLGDNGVDTRGPMVNGAVYEGAPFERARCGETTDDPNNNFIFHPTFGTGEGHIFTLAEVKEFICEYTAPLPEPAPQPAPVAYVPPPPPAPTPPPPVVLPETDLPAGTYQMIFGALLVSGGWWLRRIYGNAQLA